MVRSLGYVAKLNNVMSILGLLLLFLGCARKPRYALFAVMLAIAAYLPFGMVYGKPNFLIIASVLQTTSSESVEFVKQIPITNFLLAALFVLASSAMFFRLSDDGMDQRRLLAGAVISALCFLTYPAAGTEARKGVLVLDLPHTVTQALQQYRKEAASFRAAQASTPWTVNSVNSKYKNYVIVLGESARKDYLSAYGFKQQTTPFADQANGLFIDGYISPAGNTFASVPRILADSKGDEVLYGKNILTLAKQAGFRTYWYSNQGYVGEYDSPSSRLASSADEVYFTKWGSSVSKKVDDTALLEKLAQGLKQEHKGSRLFVLHLMGSHTAYCDRVRGEEALFSSPSQTMRCYMGSIRRTDSLLSQVYAALKADNQPFSLLYLSDHGLRHEAKGSADETVVHDSRFKQNYTVPFFILSSDADRRTTLKKDMSGFNFLRGAAGWMGIQAAGLAPYDFTQAIADTQIKVYTGAEYLDYATLKDDPIAQQ